MYYGHYCVWLCIGVEVEWFWNSNLGFVFLRLYFVVGGGFMPIFKEKDLYLGPLEFFEDEGFDARAPARAEISDLDFWSRPWPLVGCPVLSDQKGVPHSTLLCMQCIVVRKVRA